MSTPTTSSTEPTCRQCGQPKTAVPSVADPKVTLYTCERCEVSRPSTSSTDDELREKLNKIMQSFAPNQQALEQTMQLIRQDREAREADHKANHNCLPLPKPNPHFHNHVCGTCSPNGKDPGTGCINCRNTGYDQSPCLNCPGPAAPDSKAKA